MKRISSRKIKKILFGIMLSDGYIDKNGRFDLYNKNEEYINYVESVLNNITGVNCHVYKKVDKRFDSVGYRLTTNAHVYFKKLRDIFYNNEGKKVISTYILDRVDFESLAHIWMCDGYLYHGINKNDNKIQNIGYLCLEGFPLYMLEMLQLKLLYSFGIENRFEKVAWGFGYRPKISGNSLQKFIDNTCNYILPCFKYKTLLYYKSNKYIDSSLQNTEQYIVYYTNTEDIVRHS